MSSYDELLKVYKEITLLNSLNSVLYWDTNTVMPPAALSYRSTQNQYLSNQVNSIWRSDRFTSLLKESKKLSNLDNFQTRNLSIIEEEHQRRNYLPKDLMSDISKQANTTLEIWKKAKHKKDFLIVQKDLKTLFELNLNYGEVLAKFYGINDPYEGQIRVREPGMSVKFISNVFNETKKFLVPLIAKTQQRALELDYDTSFLNRIVPKHVQQNVAAAICDYYHYDIQSNAANGRLGEVEHPLTMRLGPQDVRITVNYREHKFVDSLFATHHELGHAIDGLGANPKWEGLPVNSRRFPSIGECYSRFTENKIGKNINFWETFYPKFQQLTNGIFSDVDLDTFFFGTNMVNPGPLRIGADELTYLIHIIIRFELERDLFTGKLSISEAPQAWNELYKKYLNVEVKDDTEGIMQDLHWYSLYWAYFQGYALGDIFGSQLYYTLQKHVSLDVNLSESNFLPIKHWLTEHAFSLAGLHDPLPLIETICNDKLDVGYHKNYLEKKYNKLYDL
jgi:carboxypeptidase Taq